MSDERDGAGSAGADREAGTVTDSVTDSVGDTRGQTAVVTRPARPTGKRSRRGAVDEDASEAVDLATGTEATPTKNVEASVGDSDPVKAIEDALRTFAADEIVVVTRPDDQAGWLEEGTGKTAQTRFRLPVTRVTIADDGSFAQSD